MARGITLQPEKSSELSRPPVTPGSVHSRAVTGISSTLGLSRVCRWLESTGSARSGEPSFTHRFMVGFRMDQEVPRAILLDREWLVIICKQLMRSSMHKLLNSWWFPLAVHRYGVYYARTLCVHEIIRFLGEVYVRAST